jgi:O-antigen/teichoic acid export membrane protein
MAMRDPHIRFRWVLLTALLSLVVGIILTMGYGLIGLAFIFVAVALVGGAMMSYLRTA